MPTKATTALQASATQTATSTTTGSAVNIAAQDFATCAGLITNGVTGPTLPGTFTIQLPFDNTTFWNAYVYTAGATASTTYYFTQDIPPGWQYVRSSFSGNTAQSITIQASVGYGTW
jgi:hypothetical protein